MDSWKIMWLTEAGISLTNHVQQQKDSHFPALMKVTTQKSKYY